ncbi:ROK family transcriptional regulator [Actinomyces radicidentis]|uniref:ROK family transcriptional regulator n=1 Tax=Actinomyces radicidentis TaxID=111015 RepID=UPI001F1AE928|nr:ROK family transcriptional regulator [Actinomyces radicidentis]
MPAPASPWTDLTGTQREIVLALLRSGRLPRTRLMEIVGISPGSVTRLTAPLIEAGLLTTSTERVAGTGRPQSPLELRADAEHVLGLALSNRAVTAVLTDLRASVVASGRVELAEHSPAAVLDAVAEAAALVTGARRPACTGLALGGSTTDGRVVDDAGFYGWHGVPLAALVEERLGVPAVVGNDLVALTGLEAWFGAGAESDRFALLTTGAGIGYGLVIDSEVVTSADAQLGLISNVPVPDGARPPHAAPAMECLTSAALERAWKAEVRERASAHRVVELAEGGDAVAVAVCASFARRLGRLIGMVAALTLTEEVVVAGERADLAALLEDQVMVGVSAVRRPSARQLRVTVREHDRVEWARGAAVLALRERVAGRL